MDGHGGSTGPGLGGRQIRRRAHVDGGVPRPLGVRQVVWTEEVEPAADCRAARRSDRQIKQTVQRYVKIFTHIHVQKLSKTSSCKTAVQPAQGHVQSEK